MCIKLLKFDMHSEWSCSTFSFGGRARRHFTSFIQLSSSAARDSAIIHIWNHGNKLLRLFCMCDVLCWPKVVQRNILWRNNY